MPLLKSSKAFASGFGAFKVATSEARESFKSSLGFLVGLPIGWVPAKETLQNSTIGEPRSAEDFRLLICLDSKVSIPNLVGRGKSAQVGIIPEATLFLEGGE